MYKYAHGIYRLYPDGDQCVSVYTQFADAEDELNGLMIYDRKRVNFTPEVLRGIDRKVADCKI